MVVEQCFSNFNGHINQLQILEKRHAISVNLSLGHNAAFLIQNPLGGGLKLLVLTPHFEWQLQWTLGKGISHGRFRSRTRSWRDSTEEGLFSVAAGLILLWTYPGRLYVRFLQELGFQLYCLYFSVNKALRVRLFFHSLPHHDSACIIFLCVRAPQIPFLN